MQEEGHPRVVPSMAARYTTPAATITIPAESVHHCVGDGPAMRVSGVGL